MHEHMFVRHEHRLRIQTARRAQGLHPVHAGSDPRAWDEAEQRADPALKDLVQLLRRRGGPAPECAVRIDDGQAALALADLAWPEARRAVFVRAPSGKARSAIEALGWRILTPWELLH
jgi:hypothetical protein